MEPIDQGSEIRNRVSHKTRRKRTDIKKKEVETREGEETSKLNYRKAECVQLMY
jgi:hypothetical protein